MRNLGLPDCTHLVEEAVEVNMDTLAGDHIEHDVSSVAISQAQDVAHH